MIDNMTINPKKQKKEQHDRHHIGINISQINRLWTNSPFKGCTERFKCPPAALEHYYRTGLMYNNTAEYID